MKEIITSTVESVRLKNAEQSAFTQLKTAYQSASFEEKIWTDPKTFKEYKAEVYQSFEGNPVLEVEQWTGYSWEETKNAMRKQREMKKTFAQLLTPPSPAPPSPPEGGDVATLVCVAKGKRVRANNTNLQNPQLYKSNAIVPEVPTVPDPHLIQKVTFINPSPPFEKMVVAYIPPFGGAWGGGDAWGGVDALGGGDAWVGSIELTSSITTTIVLTLSIQHLSEKLQVYAFVGNGYVPEIHPYGRIVVTDTVLNAKDYDCYQDAQSALLDELVTLFEENKHKICNK